VVHIGKFQCDEYVDHAGCIQHGRNDLFRDQASHIKARNQLSNLAANLANAREMGKQVR
jgi:hypothetical protein